MNRKVAQLFLILLLVGVLTATVCAAATTYVAEATYTGGDADTPSVAEQRALDEAKRRALEQAGEYIQSTTVVANNQVTKDEVVMLTASVVKTVLLKQTRTQNGNAMDYYAKVQCTVDDTELKKIQEQIVNNKQLLQQLATVKDNYAQIKQENERLQQLLVQATTTQQKQLISKEISANETQFTANQLVDKARSMIFVRRRMPTDFSAALSLINQALEKDSNNANAYFYRGYIYFLQKNTQQAIADYSTALRLNPKQLDAYFFRGLVYYKSNDNANALADWQQYRALGGDKPYYE